MENHWWQVALYVTSQGLTTSPMPYGNFTFTVEFDFISHQLSLRTVAAPRILLRFLDGRGRFLCAVHAQPSRPRDRAEIIPSPVDVEIAIPFTQDHEHASYDPVAAHRCWQIIAGTERVLKRFRGGFTGKQAPCIFLGQLRLAATRFSDDGLRHIRAA